MRRLALASLALLGPATALAAQCETELELSGAVPIFTHDGFAVAVAGDQAFVTRHTLSGSGLVPGERVLVLERAGTDWPVVAELAPATDLSNGIWSLTAEPGRLAVGVNGDDVAALDAGAVFLYEEVGGAWVPAAELRASDAALDDSFGYAVALDGDRIAVAAIHADPAGATSGAAYVFDLVGGAWVETAKLVPGDGAAGDVFGISLALRGDVLLVGAPFDDDLGEDSGSAYLFRRDPAGAWVQEAKLTAAGGQANDGFGSGVALAGGRAFVGVMRDDLAGFDAGSVRVFERRLGGWTETAALVAAVPEPSSRLGYAVAAEGERVLAGAPDGISGGSASLFAQDAGAWSEVARLTGATATIGTDAGFQVDLTGGRAILAAPGAYAYDPLVPQGDAYLFEVALAGAALEGCPPALSLAAGGAQALALDAGAAHAGDLHVVLGSASGTAPGFTYGGLAVPLNPDAYTLVTAANPAGLLPGGVGLLDAAGTAAASLVVPAAADPGLAGVVLHHAFGALDPATLALELVSNAAPVELVP